MKDPFENRAPSVTGPAADIVPAVPDDAADLPAGAAAVYVETGGALSVVTAAGHVRTVRVADHAVLPLRVRRVRETGTTAAGIHVMVIA